MGVVDDFGAKLPWELRDVAAEVESLEQTLMAIDDLTSEERESAIREASEVCQRLLKEAGRWVRYHSGVATRAALDSRLFAFEGAETKEHVKALRQALENVLNCDSLKEAQTVASRELALMKETSDA